MKSIQFTVAVYSKKLVKPLGSTILLKNNKKRELHQRSMKM